MKKLVLGSIFLSLFLVGCSNTQPQEEVVVQEAVIEEVVVATPEPVEVSTKPLPKPLLDK
ncbi:MAG: hypothetical protein ACRC8M_10170 [Cetobacterium sp.]|uniref:hypothetical protein n=1 Tax=Cetobacterium sp. TaxID=2071632 RepID=UPI003F35E130